MRFSVADAYGEFHDVTENAQLKEYHFKKTHSVFSINRVTKINPFHLYDFFKGEFL